MVRPAAQQFCMIDAGDLVVSLSFEGIELLAVRGQVCFERLDALRRFFGFGRDKFVLGEVGIGVDSTGERGERGGDLALKRWGGSGGRRGEGIEVFTDGG